MLKLYVVLTIVAVFGSSAGAHECHVDLAKLTGPTKVIVDQEALAYHDIKTFWHSHSQHSQVPGLVERMLFTGNFDIDRNVALAEILFDRSLKPKEIVAIRDVHQAKFFTERGLPVPAGYGQYMPAQLKAIYIALSEAFSNGDGKDYAQLIIRSGIAGGVIRE